VKASVAKGFSSPTIRELYLYPPANKKLEPERMVNYEIGVIQKLFDNCLSLELTAYKEKGDNLIKTVVLPSGIPQNQNTGSFENTGVEFSSNYRVNNALSFQLNYSYISLDKPIIATPEQQLFISSSYRWNRFTANLSLQYINNLYTQISPTLQKQTYTLVNTRFSYFINNFIDVFAKLENLTDQKYYINYGYPMPGFVSFVGINLHY
jgi:iron complex outermembrane receptor protein